MTDLELTLTQLSMDASPFIVMMSALILAVAVLLIISIAIARIFIYPYE